MLTVRSRYRTGTAATYAPMLQRVGHVYHRLFLMLAEESRERACGDIAALLAGLLLIAIFNELC